MAAFDFFKGPVELFIDNKDRRKEGKSDFLDRFRSDQSRDLLDIDPNRQFTAERDIDRLGVIAANENRGLDERLRANLGLVQDVVDRVGEQEAVDEATTRAGRQSDLDEAQFERATRSAGLSRRQRRAAQRRLGLGRALSRADAAGDVRRGFSDRARAAGRFGSSFADALFGQRLSGETFISSTAAERAAAREQRRAQKKSNKLGTLGTIAGAALSFFSDESLKDTHGREPQLLDKLKKVRVERWNYKGDSTTHIGPYSREFNDAFGVGKEDPRKINVVDALGVALGAVKELNEKVERSGL